MGGHPGLEIVLVVLIVEDRLEAREGCGQRSARVTAGQRCRHPAPALVIKTAMRSPSVSTKMALTAFPLLPPSYPRSGPPISVVLTD